MISIDELKKIKEIRKTNLYYAEKEYLQYIFLNSISKYAEDFVFKGGTCLRIVYEFERASEDLDFNTNLTINKIKKIVKNFLKHFELLNIDYEIYSEKEFEGNYRVEIRFKGLLFTGHKRTTNTIKIDFSKRKTFTKEAQIVKKLFSDVPPFTIITMGKEELLAEKFRALCMRKQARDLYDVWMLIKMKIPINKKILNKKLKEDNILKFKLNLPQKKEYQNDLKLLVNNIPKYEQVTKDIKDFINNIF